MNSAVTTLILVLVTIGLGVGVLGYYASLSSTTYNSVLPLQTAMELSKELQISYSPPVISYVVPTEKGQQLNISVDTLLTLNLNFSGTIYLIPFLMKSSYSPYYYIPSPLFSNGFINEISKPNEVGYISVTGQGVKPVELTNAQINLLTGSIANINAYAFEVPPGEELNVTFTTNYSYVPVIWVVANLYGSLYRIAYPVIESQLFVNTYSGSGSTVTETTYGQLYQELFGSYSLLFETGPASTVTFDGNDQITTYGAIGYNDGGNGQLIFVGTDEVTATSLYYSPGTTITANGPVSLPPAYPSNDIPYVPIQDLINPLYSAFNPYQYQLQLEKEANEIYNQYASQFVKNSANSITVSNPVVITQPTIFTSTITFSKAAGPGPYNITFDAPVIFEGPVTDLGVNLTFNSLVIFMNTFSVPSSVNATFDSVAVFEGDVGITNNFKAVFKEGALFNSSDVGATITFDAPNVTIISHGPLIVNLTSVTSSINFIGQCTIIYDNYPIISLTANIIDFQGQTVIQSDYPVFIQTTEGAPGTVTFQGNSKTKINGGLVINSANAVVTFDGSSELDIPNGDLLINAGSVTTSSTVFNGGNDIKVDGPIAIQSNYITFNGESCIQASGYVIFYGQQISFHGNNNNIYLNKGVPNNVENQQVVEYIIPVGLNPSPLSIAGWFSVVPNNSTSSIITATLVNSTYQVTLSLVATPEPTSPTKYNLVLYVNSTQYELTTINAYQQYMYVIEGYILQGSETCLEVTILSPSTQLVSKTIQVKLPLNTGIQVNLGPEPNYQLLIYSGDSNIWQTIYDNGPYVNSTLYLKQVASGVNYLQYYYLILPPTSLIFQLAPTYYVSSNGPLLITVEGNSL